MSGVLKGVLHLLAHLQALGAGRRDVPPTPRNRVSSRLKVLESAQVKLRSESGDVKFVACLFGFGVCVSRQGFSV